MGSPRRQPRYRTEHLRIDEPVSGRVLNVGHRGLAFETLERPFVGRSHFFRIGLGSKQLRLSGSIQWCRLVGTESCAYGEVKPVFRAGVFFADTATAEAWREALMSSARTWITYP